MKNKLSLEHLTHTSTTHSPSFMPCSPFSLPQVECLKPEPKDLKQGQCLEVCCKGSNTIGAKSICAAEWGIFGQKSRIYIKTCVLSE